MGRLKEIIHNFIRSDTIQNINKNINKIVPFFRSENIEDYYSKRVKNTKSSAIREILKVVGRPGFISFAGGLPDETLFPVKQLKRSALKTIKNEKNSVFQYSQTEGFEQLRKFIINNFYKGKELTTDNVIITHGSQQGLDLISKVFIDPGNKVGLSEPCYLGATQVFNASMAKIITTKSGNIPFAEIDRLNKSQLKFFYVIPDFHNPTGERMGLSIRKKLVNNLKCPIVEDTAYRLLSFNGNIAPSLFELDNNNRVIQLGSFSKIIAPGFRLGWICAPSEIISKIVSSKQYSDLHSNTFGQSVIYNYLVNEDWQGQIELIRKKYAEKRDIMTGAIKKYFPEGYEMTYPEGGMFIWLNYKNHKIDFYDVLEASIKQGVAIVPGSEFAVHKNLDSSVRLNFSHPAPEKIEQGIKKLGVIIQGMI